MAALLMEKIGTSNGIEAARRRENEFHPKTSTGAKVTAWDTRSHTLQLIVGDTNALIDENLKRQQEIQKLFARVAAVEARPNVPFPAA